MRIGLIDVDSHNWPNLALMKISAYHKSIGDDVEWWDGFAQYDRVYMSRVFDNTYSEDEPEPCNASEIIKGGTGYGLDNTLPDEIEHINLITVFITGCHRIRPMDFCRGVVPVGVSFALFPIKKAAEV